MRPVCQSVNQEVEQVRQCLRRKYPCAGWVLRRSRFAHSSYARVIRSGDVKMPELGLRIGVVALGLGAEKAKRRDRIAYGDRWESDVFNPV